MRKTFKEDFLSSSGLFLLCGISKWSDYENGKPTADRGTNYSCVSPSGDSLSVKIEGLSILPADKLEAKIETEGFVFIRFSNLTISMYKDRVTNDLKFTGKADSAEFVRVEIPLNF